MSHLPPTEKQLEFVAVLQREVRVSSQMLEVYCRKTWGAPLERMTRGQVSALITAMRRWQVAPAELQRAFGQMDLFTTETAT